MWSLGAPWRSVGIAGSWSMGMFLGLAVHSAAPHQGDARRSVERVAQDSAVCLAFRFGRWKPPLDWHAAGQPLTPDSIHGPMAPGGRGWASPGTSADSTLMLFPAWWPAGVVVALATRSPAVGDTVAGKATALVADGSKEPPTTEVRAWRVPCQRRDSR